MKAMQRIVYVISDLHLGGEPGTEMCSSEGRRRLVAFLARLGAEASEQAKLGEQGARVHLVIAGDLVDFLAVQLPAGGWSAFLAAEDDALRAFTVVRKQTKEFWSALGQCVQQGLELTILLGNHDVELSLPLVRRELLQLIGPGRVEFIYDNAAFRLGPLLVEHGNRYDPWNAVSHDSLRRVRSRASRGEASETFPTQPGSELVARVMNKIKANYEFIDLLKPETGAALPLLAALAPGTWLKAWPAVYQFARKAWQAQKFDAQGRPTDDDKVAERLVANSDGGSDLVAEATQETLKSGAVPQDDFPERAHFEEALLLANETVREETSEVSWLTTLNRTALLKALRYWMSHDKLTWNVAMEDEKYLKPAKALAEQGARVIVFGHTHLAKKVPLPGGAVYLNSGTWADLIRLPAELMKEPAIASAALDELTGQLSKNQLKSLRRPVPTFARIDFTDSVPDVWKADVYFVDESGEFEAISDAGCEKRLLGPVAQT